MPPYRVFLVKEVLAQLRNCNRNERELVTRFFEEIGNSPFRVGDFTDQDDDGHDVHVLIVGRYALLYWSDHAVKEVKIVAMSLAGN